ncbi:MAG: YcgN family cysteine cluster protein [Anaerolineae bacterium]|nr:YcgN family cysteine cluster protein [Anaerolineae bacterium]
MSNVNFPNFWQHKQLDELSPEEWEVLCDGCARCCLYKLQDEDSSEIYRTNVVCRLLDLTTCRCTDYPRRSELNQECVRLTPALALTLTWLPETCAYRRLALGQPLPEWHPLVSGDSQGAFHAGISVRGQVISEKEVDMSHLEDYVIEDGDQNPTVVH